MKSKRFRHWLKEAAGQSLDAISLKKEMAEIPPPGPDWNLARPNPKFGNRNQWVKRGERAVPAYTADDPLLRDPNAKHSGAIAGGPRKVAPKTPVAANPAPENSKQVPKPYGWRGPFAAKFDDKDGKFKKGDMIYWNGKSGAAGQNMPAFVPDDLDLGDEFDLSGDGSSVADKVQRHFDSQNRPSPEQVRIPPENMTEFNQEIENRFTQSSENIMVNALAGTGKTTMLKHLSSFIKPGEKWLYLVFNKKNQVESKDAFPPGVTVQTTHSFLGKLLEGVDKNLGGGTKLPPPYWKRETKLSKLADVSQITPLSWPESADNQMAEKPVKITNPQTGKKEATGRYEKVSVSPWHDKARLRAKKIAERAKNSAFDPNDPNILQLVTEMVQKYSLDTDVAKPSSKKQPSNPDQITKDIIAKAVELLVLSQPGASDQFMPYGSGYRDHDDTLWFAAMNADKINWNVGYDVVLMDEVQDFNMCQIKMAQKLREAGCRVIAVGDPNQGMYLFRGADGDAFNKLQEAIGAGDSAPLPINFRSGGNILDWVNQNTHVNNMQYPDKNAGKGEVWANGGTHDPVGYEDFMFMMMDEWDGNQKFDQDTAMIARTNAPLAHAALTFLKNNMNFQIVGTDLTKEITDLIKNVLNGANANKMPLEDFMEKLGVYRENCEKMWSNRISKIDELKEVRAYAGVLDAVYQHLSQQGFRDTEDSPPIETAGDFGNWIYRRLGGVDDNDAEEMQKLEERKKAAPGSFITLTTAHKSKGLEYDRAFLMKPGQYDPESSMVKTEAEAQQEKNAWYVAATRAKNCLMVSSDEEPDASGGGSDDDHLDNPDRFGTNQVLGKAAMAKKMRMF